MRRTAEASVFTGRNGSLNHFSVVIHYCISGPAYCSVGQNVVFVHFIRVEVIQLFIGWVA